MKQECFKNSCITESDAVRRFFLIETSGSPTKTDS